MDRNKSVETADKVYKKKSQKEIEEAVERAGNDPKAENTGRGGAREGAGRPTLSGKDKPSMRKLYRWSPEDYAKIQRAIKAIKERESVFVRTAVMEKADKVLAKKK